MTKFNLKSGAFAFLLATALSASAFVSPAIANDEVEKPVELRYINSNSQSPVYQLLLNNKTSGSYLILIKDIEGNVLFNEKVSGTSIVRNFRFDPIVPVEREVIFEVSNLQNNKVSVYNVSRSVKTIEDVVVKQVQ